ncbi:hypothetical protein Val02_54650 [Virgisporangium aliadipatigenens]|uniref:Uncharacterized protein n=1 Tax=Virgisporangium aliadipatigenens TaxID=741659 RepID=A0A8J4DSD8_9ACTN|nr:hypothetical protein Val02_54650 [Virgisporangium aliadipatigenens]
MQFPNRPPIQQMSLDNGRLAAEEVRMHERQFDHHLGGIRRIGGGRRQASDYCHSARCTLVDSERCASVPRPRIERDALTHVAPNGMIDYFGHSLSLSAGVRAAPRRADQRIGAAPMGGTRLGAVSSTLDRTAPDAYSAALSRDGMDGAPRIIEIHDRGTRGFQWARTDSGFR